MDQPLRNRAATAALVLGILGWLTFANASGKLTRNFADDAYQVPVSTLGPLVFGLLAIVFGGLGLRAVAAGAKGLVRSIIALVLGVAVLGLELIPYAFSAAG